MSNTLVQGGGALSAENPVSNLNGTASSDPDGDAISFSWSVLSKPENGNVIFLSPDSATTAVYFSSVGTFLVQLRVTDALGLSALANVSYVVANDNVFFDAFVSKGIYQAGERPEFRLKAITLPQGSALEYYVEIFMDHAPLFSDVVESSSVKTYISRDTSVSGNHGWEAKISLQNKREATTTKAAVANLRAQIVTLQGQLDSEIDHAKRAILEKKIQSKKSQVQVLLSRLVASRRSLLAIVRNFVVQ